MFLRAGDYGYCVDLSPGGGLSGHILCLVMLWWFSLLYGYRSRREFVCPRQSPGGRLFDFFEMGVPLWKWR